MRNPAQKQPVRCTEHEFALTPLQADLYFKQPITVSFCKSNQFPKCKYLEKGSTGRKSSCLCCPVFNKDKNYSTSSFILPEEKKNYIENQMKFKEAHECRIKECSDEKSLMLVPRPKTKQPYCNVCRVSFDDYLEHIKSEIHRLSVSRAPFNYLIKDMEARYDKINSGRNSHFKIGYNTDTTLNGSQSEPQIEMLGRPTKRAKSDFGFAPTFCYPFRINQITDGMKQLAAEANPIVPLPMSLGSDFLTQGIAQFPSFSNINKNEIYPIMPTMNSIPYQQMNFGFGVDTNMRMGFPVFYCGSFPSFHQLPQSYYSMPFQPSLQKIQTSQKIEQVDI